MLRHRRSCTGMAGRPMATGCPCLKQRQALERPCSQIHTPLLSGGGFACVRRQLLFLLMSVVKSAAGQEEAPLRSAGHQNSHTAGSAPSDERARAISVGTATDHGAMAWGHGTA
jgi:hypothetical protein